MIGQEIRDQVFRDTQSFYLSLPIIPAPRLLKFVQRYAGHQILDFGCATGEYCVKLAQLGFEVKGADVNASYIEAARRKGVEATVIHDRASFDDKAFDTVMSFEVLEHIPEPGSALKEMKRLARKNILITVPNCENIAELQERGLIFEHFVDRDHKNFFTLDSLTDLLKQYFPVVKVTRGDAINPLALFANRPARLAGEALRRLGLLQPQFFFRLYAVASFQ